MFLSGLCLICLRLGFLSLLAAAAAAFLVVVVVVLLLLTA